MGVVFRFLRLFAGLSVAALFVVCVTHFPAHALDYGSNPYGNCTYNKCSSTTVVTTPSGLDVAINLYDGQVLPLGIYTITVTPLNGQGATFDHVEFYLDGALLSTFRPDPDGTARWDWDTRVHRGSSVGFVIVSTDGTQTTKNFTVSMSDAKAPANTGQPSKSAGGTNSASGSGGIPIISALEQFLRILPAPLAMSIVFVPYVLLLGAIAALLWHSRREAAEIRYAQLALQRSKQLVEEKNGFLALVSHYLRTPITIIKGGVDLLQTTDAALASKMAEPTDDFGARIEQLLANVSNNQQLQTIQEPAKSAAVRPWISPGLWATIIAGAGLSLVGNYLLSRAGVLDVSPFGVLTQCTLFVCLVVGIVVVARSRRLRRQDLARATQQEAQQAAIDEARNDLIRQAATSLSNKLDNICAFLPQLPVGKPAELIKEGCDRATGVLNRFSLIAQVTPPVSSMPYTPFTFGQILDRVQNYLGAKLQNKQITLQSLSQPNIQLASQQPAWVVQALTSIVDNSIEYSASNSRIEVTTDIKNNMAIVGIRDHGQGIPAQKLDQLLQPFGRAEAPTSFDHPGLGLSLYLDRLLMTSLGGDLRIDSKPQSGTLVTLRFPIAN
jgi:signal transduction histidine kinase